MDYSFPLSLYTPKIVGAIAFKSSSVMFVGLIASVIVSSHAIKKGGMHVTSPFTADSNPKRWYN